MLVVETFARIRLAFSSRASRSRRAAAFVPIMLGVGLRNAGKQPICRELNVSRKVVGKVIRSGATEFRYAREDQSLPKTGRRRDTLDRLLSQNEAKSSPNGSAGVSGGSGLCSST